MFKACMFDLDGTLANTLESIAYFGNTALKNNGFNQIETEKYKLMVGNGADMLIRRMLKESANLYDEELVVKLRKDYDKLYEMDPMYLVSPYEGILELITSLKNSGIKLSILSNKPDDMTNAIANKLFGAGTFDFVQGQLTEFPKKPDPTAPLYILNKIGVTPSDCLYIGDSGVDMETGANAGIITAGVTWGFRSVNELKEHGGIHIISDPQEIFQLVIN